MWSYPTLGTMKPCRKWGTQRVLGAADHDFSGFDEGDGGVAGLEGGVADADFIGGLAWGEQGGRGHGVIEVPPRPYFTRFHKRMAAGLGNWRETV